MRVIRAYLGRYTTGLVVGGVCLLLTDLLLLANPWILKLAIDELKTGITRERLFFYAQIFVAITAASGVFRFLMRRIMIGISRKIELDIRADFFAHLQTLSPSFYHKNRTGDLMALATNDLAAVRTLVGPGVMYTLNTMVVSVLAISLMTVLSPTLTLAPVLPMAVLSVAVYYSVKLIHRLFERVQEQFADINSRAQENLSGIRVVKSYAREEHEVEEFTELSREYVRHNMKLFRVQSFLNPLLTTVAGLGGLFILGVGGKLVIDQAITLGTFVAFNGYLMMLVWPMIAFGWVMNILQRGLASMERINRIMDTAADIKDPEEAAAADHVRDNHAIRFENVSFSYHRGQGRDRVLKDINLTIGHGETVALVGPTGSGKTTLVSLLLRLYDPTSGRVLIGDRGIDAIPLRELRNMIGLVPQDIFLFSDTVRENIGFGVNELEEEVLHDVSRTASIEGEILNFPHGFESRIGERGINLSGGQKQRIAIARALAKDPAIMVFDDALSSVDTDTEDRILQALRSQMRRRTGIIISHRISTAREADRIFVLDEGELVEQGTHEELVERGGIYADMNHKQLILSEMEREG